MKRAIALFLVVFSAAYLLVIGPMPDPVPVIDEALALMVLVQSLAALGINVRRWLPWLRRRAAAPVRMDRGGPTIDV